MLNIKNQSSLPSVQVANIPGTVLEVTGSFTPPDLQNVNITQLAGVEVDNSIGLPVYIASLSGGATFQVTPADTLGSPFPTREVVNPNVVAVITAQNVSPSVAGTNAWTDLAGLVSGPIILLGTSLQWDGSVWVYSITYTES